MQPAPVYSRSQLLNPSAIDFFCLFSELSTTMLCRCACAWVYEHRWASILLIRCCAAVAFDFDLPSSIVVRPAGRAPPVARVGDSRDFPPTNKKIQTSEGGERERGAGRMTAGRRYLALVPNRSEPTLLPFVSFSSATSKGYLSSILIFNAHNDSTHLLQLQYSATSSTYNTAPFLELLVWYWLMLHLHLLTSSSFFPLFCFLSSLIISNPC